MATAKRLISFEYNFIGHCIGEEKNNPPDGAVCLESLTIYLIFVSLSGILETWKDDVGGVFPDLSVFYGRSHNKL
jgi:hypothetical protein